jgi:regulatory protein
MSRTISEVAMGFLARREHSRHELVLKLLKKQFLPDEISTCLDSLEQRNYLSDSRFIASFTRYRANSGFGPKRIRADLLQRGIKAKIIDSYLASVAIDWESHLQQAWCKKFNQMPIDVKTLSKQTRFLLQRGFQPDSVRRLLKNF